MAAGMVVPRKPSRSTIGRTMPGVWATMAFVRLGTMIALRFSIPFTVESTTVSSGIIFHRPRLLPPHSVLPAGSACTSSITGVLKKVGWTLPTRMP